MRVVRRQVDGAPAYAELREDGFAPLDSARAGDLSAGGADFPPFDVPVAPTKILTVVDAFGMEDKTGPLRFGQKATSALVGHLRPIVYPAGLEMPLWAEGELGVVIGRTCFQADPDEAGDAIFGFVCVNDVTAVDFARRDAFRCKSYDTFCPIGPHIATGLQAESVAQGIEIITRVNGEVRQQGSTKDLRFSVEEVLSTASSVATLLPGDVIALGTPPPPAEVWPGDVVEIDIEQVGLLSNPVLAAAGQGD